VHRTTEQRERSPSYFALGARARHVLDDLERWMAPHNAAIMIVLCLVIAVKLIGEGITGLS
jgi:hypothetical protein